MLDAKQIWQDDDLSVPTIIVADHDMKWLKEAAENIAQIDDNPYRLSAGTVKRLMMEGVRAVRSQRQQKQKGDNHDRRNSNQSQRTTI